jgi:hypothetical protein
MKKTRGKKSRATVPFRERLPPAPRTQDAVLPAWCAANLTTNPLPLSFSVVDCRYIWSIQL